MAAIGWVSEEVAEKDGGRDGGVVEPGKGEFADVEVPVGMAGPFDIEGLAVVKLEVDLFADKLVDDGAIVDTADGDEAAAIAVAEAGEAVGVCGVGIDRFERGDVDDADTEAIGGDVEVGQGLLVGGIDVDEDNGFGIVAGDDGAIEEVPEGRFGEAAEEIVEAGRQRKGGAEGFAEGPLKAEDGGESLHFDEAGSETAAGFAHETEVGGEELRVGILVGGAPFFGDGDERLGEVFRVGEEPVGEVGADAGHFVEKLAGEEAGRFSDGEGDVSARDSVKAVEQGPKGLGAKTVVEVLTQRGKHRGRVTEISREPVACGR